MPILERLQSILSSSSNARHYTQALQLNPKLAEAYGGRGFARIQQGDLSGAIADCNQALQLNPKLAEAYGTQGTARFQQSDLSGAIADYTQAKTVSSIRLPLSLKKVGVPQVIHTFTWIEQLR